MSATRSAPAAEELAKLLSGLLGKRITSKPGTALAPDAKCPCVVALFAADDGTPAAACVCDVALAARLGAALTLFPKNAAEECISAGRLSEALLDNLREVMNVVSRMFNTCSSLHTRLSSVHSLPPEKPPAALASLLAKPAGRRDVELDVDSYGAGRLSILLAG